MMQAPRIRLTMRVPLCHRVPSSSSHTNAMCLPIQQLPRSRKLLVQTTASSSPAIEKQYSQRNGSTHAETHDSHTVVLHALHLTAEATASPPPIPVAHTVHLMTLRGTPQGIRRSPRDAAP